MPHSWGIGTEIKFVLGVVVKLEAEILKLALSQGIFAALFIWLLFWVLKENAKREAAGAAREAEFQKIISELVGKVRASICDVQDDLKEIKDKFFR